MEKKRRERGREREKNALYESDQRNNQLELHLRVTARCDVSNCDLFLSLSLSLLLPDDLRNRGALSRARARAQSACVPASVKNVKPEKRRGI
jgi:hypothetical protein